MAVADPVDAWRELRAPLAGFIARRLADPRDAEDVLQEVMLRIHRHSDELATADRVSAWVHRIARNAIVDHYRRRAARPETPTATLEEPEVGSLDDEGSEALRRELAACLRPLVDRMRTSS